MAPADVDETPLPGERPVAMARRLAVEKARMCDVPGVLIAGDTVVAGPDGAEILGKPEDDADARRMLRLLRGKQHTVITAVAVRNVARGAELVEHVVTAVEMRPYGDAEIDGYVESGLPLDKAGAYGIQDGGFAPVTAIAGCYLNVVGFPLCVVARLLRQAGLAVPDGLYTRRDCDCSADSALHQPRDLHPAS